MSICTKSPGGAQKKKFFHLQFLEIWYCICWWRRWSKCTLTWECFGNCYSQGEVWIQLIRNVCSKPTPLQQPKNPTVLYHNDIIRLIESLAAIKTIHACSEWPLWNGLFQNASQQKKQKNNEMMWLQTTDACNHPQYNRLSLFHASFRSASSSFPLLLSFSCTEEREDCVAAGKIVQLRAHVLPARSI